MNALDKPGAIYPLRIRLPLPPTDNECHRHRIADNRKSGLGRRIIRHPTNEYIKWIKEARELLLQQTEGIPTDELAHWRADIELYLPNDRSDGQNYTKPLLDLLAGSYVETEGGSKRIKHEGGVLSNDKRIKAGSWDTRLIGCPKDMCMAVITIKPEHPPMKYGK